MRPFLLSNVSKPDSWKVHSRKKKLEGFFFCLVTPSSHETVPKKEKLKREKKKKKKKRKHRPSSFVISLSPRYHLRMYNHCSPPLTHRWNCRGREREGEDFILSIYPSVSRAGSSRAEECSIYAQQAAASSRGQPGKKEAPRHEIVRERYEHGTAGRGFAEHQRDCERFSLH